MAQLNYKETPIQEVKSAPLKDAGIRLLVKREDLNHPHASGNKWWKLKYNLEACVRSGHDTLLTFGGAYSNHIFATAAAAHELGLKSIGIIRGEETLPLNHTLSFAKENGMMLQYVSREDYRHKTEENFIEKLHKQFGDFYLIPEGGTNELAIKGCEEFAKKLRTEIDFDYIYLAVGTGGTMAGIIAGLGGEKKVIGISVLKNGEFLNSAINKFLLEVYSKPFGNWSTLTSYDHGGYAKVTGELTTFIDKMQITHQLPLDSVYSGKLMKAVMEEVRRGDLKEGSVVLAIHTGGLQRVNY